MNFICHYDFPFQNQISKLKLKHKICILISILRFPITSTTFHHDINNGNANLPFHLAISKHTLNVNSGFLPIWIFAFYLVSFYISCFSTNRTDVIRFFTVPFVPALVTFIKVFHYTFVSILPHRLHLRS